MEYLQTTIRPINGPRYSLDLNPSPDMCQWPFRLLVQGIYRDSIWTACTYRFGTEKMLTFQRSCEGGRWVYEFAVCAFALVGEGTDNLDS